MEMSFDNEPSLRVVCDGFVTFLYAAAVHLIIAHSASRPGALSGRISFVVLLYILHLFSDWLSRVRLPWLLPPRDQVGTGSQLAKTLLEVGGLFFLVVAWLSLLEAAAPQLSFTFVSWLFAIGPDGFWQGRLSPERAFAIFLVATFFWNLFMLRVMRDLDWVDLARLIFAGNAVDSPKVESYAQRFWRFREKLERWVANKEKNSYRVVNPYALLAVIIDFSVRGFAQLVAFHIAWSGIFGSAVILTSDLALGGQPLVVGIKGIANTVGLALAISLFTIFVVIMPSWDILRRGLDSNRPAIRQSGRVLSILLQGIGVCSFVLLGVKISVIGADLFRWLGWWSLLLGAVCQSACFFWAAQFSPKTGSRNFCLRLSGTVGTMAMLVIYLSFGSRSLMILIAIQQVLVNAFLQYAASHPEISISPRKLITSPTAKHQFAATLSGDSGSGIVWMASPDGSIDRQGLYTVPSVPGKYSVYAISAADRSRFAEATVIVLLGD